MKETITDFVASTSCGEPKTRFKYQTLLQEYHELREEMRFKLRNLEMKKQKLSTLKAEVGFLRRRYKHLKQDQTLETTQKMLTLSESGDFKVPSKPPSGKRKRNSGLSESVPCFDSKQKEVLAADNGSCDLEKKPKRIKGNENLTNSISSPDLNGERNTSVTNKVTEFDLNQISREEEEPEANGEQRAVEAMEGDVHEEVKIPISRDVEKELKKEVKRKVTWREPVTLNSVEVFSKNMKIMM